MLSFIHSFVHRVIRSGDEEGHRLPGAKSWLCSIVPSSWTSDLLPLCLSFLICVMGIATAPACASMLASVSQLQACFVMLRWGLCKPYFCFASHLLLGAVSRGRERETEDLEEGKRDVALLLLPDSASITLLPFFLT